MITTIPTSYNQLKVGWSIYGKVKETEKEK